MSSLRLLTADEDGPELANSLVQQAKKGTGQFSCNTILLVLGINALSYIGGAFMGLPQLPATLTRPYNRPRAVFLPKNASLSSFSALAPWSGLVFDNACVTRQQLKAIDSLGTLALKTYLADFPAGAAGSVLNPFLAASPYAQEGGRGGARSALTQQDKSLSFAELIQLQKDVVRWVQESTDVTWHPQDVTLGDAAVDQWFSKHYDAFIQSRASTSGLLDFTHSHGLNALKQMVREKRGLLPDLRIRISNTLFQPVIHPEYGVIAVWTTMPDVSSATGPVDTISYRGLAVTLVIVEDGRWKYRLESPLMHDEGEIASSTGGKAIEDYMKIPSIDLSGEVEACHAPPAPQDFLPKDD